MQLYAVIGDQMQNHYSNERDGMCELMTPGFLIGSTRALKRFEPGFFVQCPMHITNYQQSSHACAQCKRVF
jgi:hypothetical protein